MDVLIQKYLKYERIVAHRQSIEKLVREKNEIELKRVIGKRLTFGTAGIRGCMGPGFGQMNDLVIIQTSQGLASYLIESEPKAAKEQGVIIGHDARHNSDRFARLAAIAFLQKGIPVYFCDHIVPTPLIAFGVKHFSCVAGVVVTASHNPKEDNGYKVYWSNGAQILSPHDVNIQEHIMRDSNQEPWPRAWDDELIKLPQFITSPSTATATNSMPKEWADLLNRIHGDLCKNYFSYIETLVDDRRNYNKSSNVCITYTTMHGVGHVFLSRALELAGFEDVFPVESQKKPDPNFSTVKFPNPEEAGVLDLAFETAKHANSNLILANDPDADRCAAALYEPKSHYKRILNGNEIGALLGWWIWHCWRAPLNLERRIDFGYADSQGSSKADKQPNADDDDDDDINILRGSNAAKGGSKKPSDCYMISTAVSSKFLESMAKAEGFHFMETLTGFKYMGNIADELIRKHSKNVLFAYEEAIGYMVDSTVLDKDGLSAAIQIAQCAAYLSTNYGRTLEQQLDYLYTRYGYHYNINSYYTCSDPNIVRQIFKDLQSDYPRSFTANLVADDADHTVEQRHTFKVSRVRDLNNDFDSGTEDKRPTLPCSSSSFMVTFFIEADNITFTMRTSGTEPKIKYYSEIVNKLPPLNQAAAIESNNFNDEPQRAAKIIAQNKLRALVYAAIERCLKPELYNLEPAGE